MKKLVIVSSMLFLSGCFSGGNVEAKIALGKSVFDKNCVSCHGKAAVGLTKDWKQPLANGKYPAPPLNGSAHTWHHSPKLLLSTINNGGAKLGGWMPPFKDKLSEEEKQATLAYLRDLWPADIQKKYSARFKSYSEN